MRDADHPPGIQSRRPAQQLPTHVLSWSPQTEAQKLREAPPASLGLSALLPPAGPFTERNTNVKNALVESLRRLFTEQVHEVPRGRA